jgi:hypothetical protein
VEFQGLKFVTDSLSTITTIFIFAVCKSPSRHKRVLEFYFDSSRNNAKDHNIIRINDRITAKRIAVHMSVNFQRLR